MDDDSEEDEDGAVEEKTNVSGDQDEEGECVWFIFAPAAPSGPPVGPRYCTGPNTAGKPAMGGTPSGSLNHSPSGGLEEQFHSPSGSLW